MIHSTWLARWMDRDPQRSGFERLPGAGQDAADRFGVTVTAR